MIPVISSLRECGHFTGLALVHLDHVYIHLTRLRQVCLAFMVFEGIISGCLAKVYCCDLPVNALLARFQLSYLI